MKTLVWTLTAAALLLWSLVAWVTHGLVGVAGSLVAGNVDLLPADPLLTEWAWWFASVGTGLGEWLVVAVWAVVSLGLVALAFVATRLLPRLAPKQA